MTVSIKVYTEDDRFEWNNFVSSSRNGHFMFDRSYMEYHSDRFSDFSLMAYDQKNKLIAVLPANISGKTIYSHQGLSFGGLVISNKVGAEQVIEIFEALTKYLRVKSDVNSLVYKRIPDFYCSYPSQEDLYSLFLLGANLIRRDVSVAVDLENPLPIKEMRRRKIKKAIKHEITVNEDEEFSEFWGILAEVLEYKHGATPVHTVDEIMMLKSRFPENIRCFTARLSGKVLAGTVVFETDTVAHAQYLASNHTGRELGALDLVIAHLKDIVYSGKRYFDFGISTENDGRYLNKGLISQKEGFGARAFVHDFYEIDVK